MEPETFRRRESAVITSSDGWTENCVTRGAWPLAQTLDSKLGGGGAQHSTASHVGSHHFAPGLGSTFALLWVAWSDLHRAELRMAGKCFQVSCTFCRVHLSAKRSICLQKCAFECKGCTYARHYRHLCHVWGATADQGWRTCGERQVRKQPQQQQQQEGERLRLRCAGTDPSPMEQSKGLGPIAQNQGCA